MNASSLAADSVVAQRFAVERTTGQGGMGTIYRARDLVRGEVVALKLLHHDGVHVYERERFMREAEVLAELRHPGIVAHVAHGYTDEGQPFLAMEWLEGEDLAQRLARRPLTVAESVALIRRAAEALAVAHPRGIVHRDLKPSNLFLRGGDVDRVTLLDFGIARRSQRVSLATLTQAGAVIGTPAYMAPEQARGEPEVAASADVFSLGCVLFECLTGETPFHAEHLVAQLVKTLFEEAPRLRSLRPELPAELDALVARMLAKAASARPRDAAALVAALAGLQDLPEAPWSAAVVPEAPALAALEQQFVSVIMAMDAVEPALQMQETMPVPRGASEDVGHRSLCAVLERLGAAASCLADGSVVATLRQTGRRAATDQAAQAARCALAIRERWPGALIALATERAVVAGTIPLGDAIDRAARTLLEHAQTTSGRGLAAVWLDEVTAGLLGPRFVVTRDASGALALQGEQLSADESRPLLGKPTPCVGREQELGTLEGMLAACVEESAACAVLVTAAPGMGKSRLRHEFLRRVAARGEPTAVLQGRVDPVLAGAPFCLLSSALRHLCGVAPGQDPARQRTLMEERVAQCVAEDGRAGATEALLELCDLAPAPARAGPRDPLALASRARPALLAVLRGLCARGPVVLALEDLQWGDVYSLALVEAALRELRDQPLMVMALARPEVDELFPRLWSGLVQAMPLRALSRRASERLVTQALAGSVAAEVATRIAEQAGGNALYLEEIVRAVAAGKGEELPDTVLAMVQARLARLEPESRRVLRVASVLGNHFWRGAALRLLGQEPRTGGLDGCLAELVAAEVIERRGDGRISGDVEYVFRHDLLREAAYGWLTAEDRASAHAAAGRFVQDAGEARHHHRCALAALAVLPDTPANRRARVDVTLRLIGSSRAAESPAHNLALLSAAEVLLRGIAPESAVPGDRRELARIHYWIGTEHYLGSQMAQAARHFKMVLEHEDDEESLVALPSAALGRMYAVQGQFGRAVPLLRRSQQIVLKTGDWAEWAASGAMLGMALAARGQCKESLVAGQGAVARALQLGDPTTIAAARGPLSATYLFLGDMQAMLETCDACAGMSERSGDRIYVYMVRGLQIWAASRLGDVAMARAMVAITREIAAGFGRQIIASDWIAAATAEMTLRHGDPSEAARLAEEAVALGTACGGVFAVGMAERVWAQALAAASPSRWPEVQMHMQRSLAALDAGECFVESARTRLAWGELARARGDGSAAELLAAAAGQFAASGLTAELELARGLGG